MNVFYKAFKCLMAKEEDIPAPKKKKSIAERIKKFSQSSSETKELQMKMACAVNFSGKRKGMSPPCEPFRGRGPKRGSFERINSDNWDISSISSESSSSSIQNVHLISQEDVRKHSERGGTQSGIDAIVLIKPAHQDESSSFSPLNTSIESYNLKLSSSLVEYSDSSNDESSLSSSNCVETKRTEHWNRGSVYTQLNFSGMPSSWLDKSFQSPSSSCVGSLPSVDFDHTTSASPRNCYSHFGSSESISQRSSYENLLSTTPALASHFVFSTPPSLTSKALLPTPPSFPSSMPSSTPHMFQTPFVPRGLWKPLQRSHSFNSLERSRADANLNWRSGPRSPSPVRLSNQFTSILPWYDAEKLLNLKLGIGVIDTHCHLDFLFRRSNYRETYNKYKEENASSYPACYEGCIAIFCDPSTFQQKDMWESFLDCDGVWAAFGCHPHMAHGYTDMAETYLKESFTHDRVIALGEIGLDYSSNNKCDRDVQKKVFKRQLVIGVSCQYPLVIHCRDAYEDCITIMKEVVPFNYRIHMHCFTGNWEEAQLWLNAYPNLYLGVTALVTYPSAKTVHEAVRNIPLKRLLLETDTPYFVPRAVSGVKWSHPGMVIHVAAQVAAIKKDVTLNEVLQAVRENTRIVYGI